jgi:hypothetical protein
LYLLTNRSIPSSPENGEHLFKLPGPIVFVELRRRTVLPSGARTDPSTTPTFAGRQGENIHFPIISPFWMAALTKRNFFVNQTCTNSLEEKGHLFSFTNPEIVV